MPRTALGDQVRLFGVRHHGPGSSRSLVRALEDWRPDLLLVEGPSEAGAIVPHLLDERLKTPVAMLFYVLETPRWSTYYPLVDFSPELQACRWAAERSCPVNFIDLPASAMLGFSVQTEHESEALELAALAAGFEDGEDWWEHLVEQRENPCELFEGIEALMGALREVEIPTDESEREKEDEGRKPISDRDFEAIREAHMRSAIRRALHEGHKVAIVCGAWHVPALRDLPSAKEDDALLKGLPKLRVGSTVVPWTFERLTFASGYGAGARSPAFYDLLWRTPAEDVPRRWLMEVARLMRDEDLDASPASVIEAVRLADALSALRGRPRPGLRELCDAAGAVLVRDPAIWRLISRRLIVGESFGEVPSSVPKIPLQSDLEAEQRRLRMKCDDTDRVLELDLRGDIDLGRSHLLHRLDLLEVPWGVTERVSGKKGTFHEHWRVQWRPELTIQLIEASVFGNTVSAAATAKAIQACSEATSLSQIAQLVGKVLLADLPEAVGPAVLKLQALSATSADVADLADSLPPLAAVVRYGTVRRTEVEQVEPVLDAIFTRLCVGLPGACTSLDDEAARSMINRLDDVSGVVRLFEDPAKSSLWTEVLASIAGLQGCHHLVMGKAERIRFDWGAVDGDWLAQRLGQEASVGATSLETASFVEGLLDGSGAILLHQDPLLNAVDEWLVGLDPGIFEEGLPLIRRTFALFTKPERRQIGERIAGGQARAALAVGFDEERGRRVLPVIRQILGLPHE